VVGGALVSMGGDRMASAAARLGASSGVDML